MQLEQLKSGSASKTPEDTILTNLLGPIKLTQALLPHLLKQKNGAVMTVTSGLAFVPAAYFPTYCATKAGLHSYTESLRYQLKDTQIQVLELAPPYVQTELTGPQQAKDSSAMPLQDFIQEVMDLIKEDDKISEILVKKVRPMRSAAFNGETQYHVFFKQLNDYMATHRS